MSSAAAGTSEARPPEAGLTSKIALLLGVPEGLGGRALRLLALVFTTSVSLALLKTAQRGIFLGAYTKEAIPWAFAASAVLLALTSSWVVALVGRRPLGRIATAVVAGGILLSLALVAALQGEQRALPFAAYVVIEAYSGVLLIQTWSVVGASVDARSARKIFPIAGLGAGLAWTLAGFLVGPLAGRVGAVGLLLISPLPLLLALLLLRSIARRDLRDRSGRRRGSLLASWKEGFGFVFGSPLMRLAALLSTLAIMIELLMDYALMSEARHSLGSADAISSFFGTYYGVTSAVGLLALAGLSGRLLSSLGTSRSLAAMPLALFGAAAVAVAVPTLWAVVALRGIGRVLKQSLFSSASEQLQTPLLASRRSQAKTAIRGVLAPTVYALLSLMMAAFPDSLSTRAAAFGAALLSLAMVLLALFSAKKRYLAALEEALDERRLSLSPGDRSGADALLDPEALSLLHRDLRGEDRDRALLAAEVLGMAARRGSAEGVIEALLGGLAHPEAEVRILAVEGLAHAEDPRTPAALAARLIEESEPAVGRALCRALGAQHAQDAEVLEALREAEAQNRERDPELAELASLTHSALSLEGEALGRALLPALASGDRERARAALSHLEPSSLSVSGMGQALRTLLEGKDEALALLAAEVVVSMGLLSLLPDVVRLLRDPRLGPRTARVLVEIGDGAFASEEGSKGGGKGSKGSATTLASLTEVARRLARAPSSERSERLVRRLLGHGDERIRRHATEALAAAIRAGRHAPLPARVVAPLIEQEARRAYALCAILAGLAHDDGVPDWEVEPEFQLLAEEIEHKRERSRGAVLTLLLLLGEQRIVTAVEVGMRQPSARRDAQIAELLSVALPRSFASILVPLFERLSLRERAEAARALGAMDEAAVTDPLFALVDLGDDHLLLCARLAYGERFMERFSELGSKTDMLPRLEKLRFLRSVPLFSRLSGEDLMSLAEVLESVELGAGEQLFAEGDPGEDLYLIAQGEIEIRRGGTALAKLGEKEIFGDLAVLDPAPRSADAVATRASSVLRLRGPDLRELMSTRPTITEGMVRVLARRLRDADARISG